MKHLLKLFFILSIGLLWSCDDDEVINHNNNLEDKVNELIGNQQNTPESDDFNSINWKCSDWLIRFYDNNEKIGEWNSFEKTIANNEKNQIYRFENDQLSITTEQETKTAKNNKTYQFTWDDEGNLYINKIHLICKTESGKFYMYFNTEDNEAIGEIFNVSVDNTFGNTISSATNLQGLGMIGLQQNSTPSTPELEMTSYDLVQKFHDREQIVGQVFNSIEITGDNYEFTLSNGQDQQDHVIQISNQQIDLANVTPERARLLFEKFMNKKAFTFLNVEVNINRIDHEDGSGNSFIVNGTAGNEEVTFYYNTESGKEHWLNAPTSGNQEMASYDLVQKFHDREQIVGQIFNTIEITDDNYEFTLSNGQDQQDHVIQISNQQIDLANVTPERARLLFEKFMNKQTFTFLNVEVNINKIDHEDGSGNSFIVSGTAGNEKVTFYYNTESGKEHWLDAPTSGSQEMASYDLVQKFHDREQIVGQIFNTIEITNDNYEFTLSNGQDQQDHVIQISNQQIDLANVTPERARLLFEKFMNKQTFTFLNVEVNINKIDHEDGSGNSFIVSGTAENEKVTFYYNTESGKEHWLDAPTSGSQEMASYDLIQKFNDREQILGQIFNTIEITDNNYQFTLSDGNNQQEYIIQITNQEIDLANITPERAKVLFEKFMNKQEFTFKNVEVMISKINHEDGSGNSFIVSGSAGNENVSFYYNTESDKEHWLTTPSN